jgi:hypothetical protein
MAKENNYMMPLVAMVAIVAIVGVTIMFLNVGTSKIIPSSSAAALDLSSTSSIQLTANQEKIIDDSINNLKEQSNTIGGATNFNDIINECGRFASELSASYNEKTKTWIDDYELYEYIREKCILHYANK